MGHASNEGDGRSSTRPTLVARSANSEHVEPSSSSLPSSRFSSSSSPSSSSSQQRQRDRIDGQRDETDAADVVIEGGQGISNSSNDTGKAGGGGGGGGEVAVLSSAWRLPISVVALVLGQFLSVVITGTGVTSQLLSSDRNMNIPTTQSFGNYLLLFLVYTVPTFLPISHQLRRMSLSFERWASRWVNLSSLKSHANNLDGNTSASSASLSSSSSASSASASSPSAKMASASPNITLATDSLSQSAAEAAEAAAASGETEARVETSPMINCSNGSGEVDKWLIEVDPFERRTKFLKALRERWLLYLLLGIIDVEANYVVVKAYGYTNILSIMLLDCFSIPCVMLLSFFFLGTRYRWMHAVGVLACLIGLGVLIASDVITGRADSDDQVPNALLGDMLCILGAALYAISNVLQEYTVKVFDPQEFLSMIGLFGVVINGLQLILIEREELAQLQGDPESVGLIAGFSLCMFTFYSLVPFLLMISSATMMNLSFLTSDFYGLAFGIFLFQYAVTPLYLLAFVLIIIGLIIYNRENTLQGRALPMLSAFTRWRKRMRSPSMSPLSQSNDDEAEDKEEEREKTARKSSESA